MVQIGGKGAQKDTLCRCVFQVSGDLFGLLLFLRLDRLGHRGAAAFTHVPGDASKYTSYKKYLTTSCLLFLDNCTIYICDYSVISGFRVSNRIADLGYYDLVGQHS